ncbi:MAG: hypothetical protein WC516_07260 [Patescibacteria group bacterium]|jgi:dTDP-D-glucose 4,6-dehydratase
MEKKKILVCGSAGFLMSNFIRYLMYMTRETKEFEIVSVDKLKKINDYKRVYLNKDHKFYIGNIADEYFIDRLLFIENPDFIVNGCFYTNQQANNFNEILTGTTNLLRAKAPLIQICGCIEPLFDYIGFWNCISKIIENDGETVIEIPNVFGCRQRVEPWFSVPWIQNSLLKHKTVKVRDEKFPWVFAEDVASLIWFVLDNKIKGHIKMPVLGYLSEKEIAECIQRLYNIDFNICVSKPSFDHDYMVKEYNGDIINNWKPDSNNINSSLEKTIKWFDHNRWAFNL